MGKEVWRCWDNGGRCRELGRTVWCVSRWTSATTVSVSTHCDAASPRTSPEFWKCRTNCPRDGSRSDRDVLAVVILHTRKCSECTGTCPFITGRPCREKTAMDDRGTL